MTSFYSVTGNKCMGLVLRRCVALFSVGIVLLATSCGFAKGYPGPQQKSAALAIVRSHGVTLHQVNGIEIGATSKGVLVMPGTNEFQLSINASNYNYAEQPQRLFSLRMNARPGIEYVVTARRGDGIVCAYELDSNTGQPLFSSSAGCLNSR